MNFFANILESDLDRFKSIFEIYNKLYNRNIEVIISRNTYDLIGKVIENTWDQAKKFYTKDNSIDESNLTSQIEEIISSEVYLRYVKYGDGDMEKDPETVKDASVEIVKLLKSKGLL